MENEILYFLPSEIARLVLGYLLDEGYKSTYRSFLKECPSLKEYLACVAQGHTYSLKINCMSLVEILEQYGHLKSGEITRKIANPSMASLWKQFDNVVDLIKKQVTSTQFLYEGSMVQSSRTKKQIRHVQRNKILQSCVSTMEKQPKSRGSSAVNTTEACSPVAGTSSAVSPCHEQIVDTNNSSPKTLVLEEDADHSDDNEPMDTCPVDDSEVAALLHDTPPNNPEADSGKDGRDRVEDNAEPKTELKLTTEDKLATPDEGSFVGTVVTSVPVVAKEKSKDPQTQHVPPSSSDTTAPRVPTVGPQSPVEQSSECGPVSATEERVPSVGLQTPVKHLQQTNTDSVTDKSPRRKRPPKRKSFGERRKSQPEKPGNSVQNESSNSTDGSLHDNMVPQIMNQLLSNPHLTHKLAKNINKSLHPDATPPPSPSTETRTFHDIGHTSLEDILDEHETRMTRSQIDSIICNTQSDPDLGELFGIFDLSLLSSGPRDQHNSMNSITPGSSQTALPAGGTEPVYTEVTDTHRDLCTPRPFTPVEEVTRGQPIPSASQLSVSKSPQPSPQEPVKELPNHFTPISDIAYDPASATDSVKSNQPLRSCSHKLDNCVMSPVLSSEHVPKTTDSVMCTPVPGRNDPSVQHNVSCPVSSPKRVVTQTQSNKDHLIISSVHNSLKKSSPEGVQNKLQQSSPVLAQAVVSDRINVAHTNTTSVASITNCVTAQPFATMVTSHQPIASQPSSQPVTTAVTSLQPITSAFSPEFGPMRMNVEASTHGFPVLSLTATLQSDLDVSDCVNKSSTENMSRRMLSGDKRGRHFPKCSTAKKSVINGSDVCVNNSDPVPQPSAATCALSTAVITTEASSVVQALATSADSLSTINIQSLYGTVDNTQQDTGKVVSKGKKELKKKRTSTKNKSETSRNLSGWSSELSALVKITSPEKKTSETSNNKKTPQPARTTSNSVEKLKEQQTYMAVLSPGGSTVQQIPVLEVDSLSEFGDAKDLIPVGTMVHTSQLPKPDTPTKTESKKSMNPKTKSKAKLRSPRISVLKENMSEVCPALLTSSPRPNSTAVKSQNQQSGDQPSLLSMPTLHSLSSPCSLSTSLSLPLMLSSQQAANVSQSNVANTPPVVEMSPIPRIPQVKQASLPAESTEDIKRTPEKILSAVYSADRDFLDSPQSVDYTELNESTGEDLAHKLFENAQRLQDKDVKTQECQKSYIGSSLEKQSGKELHVRSLNFGVSEGLSSTEELSPVVGVGKLPSKSQLQQRIIFGLEVIQSGDGVRQLAYGRGHKNPNRSVCGHISPGVKKKTKSSSGKKRATKSTSKGRQRTLETTTHTSSQGVDIDCQTDLPQDPVTHVVMDRQTFIKEKSKKSDKTILTATTETGTDASFNASKNSAIVDTDGDENMNDTVNLKPIENKENIVEEPVDKEVNVTIAQKNDVLEDFIPDSSGKVYLSPAMSVVLTPEKSEENQGQMQQLSSVNNIKQPGSSLQSGENISNCLGSGLKSFSSVDIVSGNVGNKIQNVNIVSKEKELSDSEYSSAEFEEATHSESSDGEPTLHHKSDMDIFADTDDDSLLPGVTPPVVVSEISHDIAIIPSVFSDRRNKAKSKSVLQHTGTAKSFAKEAQISCGTIQSFCNQETSDNGCDDNVNNGINQPGVDGNRTNGDNSLSREIVYKIRGDNSKSGQSLSRSSNKHQMTETLKQHAQCRQHKNLVHSVQSRVDNGLPSCNRRYISNVDCHLPRQNNISTCDIDGGKNSDVLKPHFNREGSESSKEEEEEIDIMGDWDNPWQSGLTNAIAIENPPVQERTIQHDFTGIQRTKRHDFIAENIEMHKSMNMSKNDTSLQGSDCTEHGPTDTVHHSDREYPSQETEHDSQNIHKGRMTLRNSRGRNQSPQITSSVNRSPKNSRTTTVDNIVNRNSTTQQSFSSHGSNNDVQQNSNQRFPSAINVQGQQSQINSSRLRPISFKKYQPASVKVSYSSIEDEEDSYDLPDLSTPTKASDIGRNHVLGSGLSNRSSASRTSFQSDITANLYQHVTPPKKRITASLKNGDSLYFFSSTQPVKPNRTKSEQPSGKQSTAWIYNKESPQKTVHESSKATNSVNSPRRPRKATLTPRKELTTVDQGSPSKSRPAASSKEEATQTVMRRPKRQREENNDKEHKTPKKKTKKGKKLVDLSKLDVDKFLSKLYK